MIKHVHTCYVSAIIEVKTCIVKKHFSFTQPICTLSIYMRAAIAFGSLHILVISRFEA